MIRKAIIVVLTFISLVVGGLLAGTYIPWRFEVVLNPSSEAGGLNFNPPSAPYMFNTVTIETGQLSWFCVVFVSEDSFPQPRPPKTELTFGPFSYFDEYVPASEFGTSQSFSERRRIVEFPLIAPFILFGSYPAIAFIRGPLRRWRRRRKGLCLKCGYELIGNVSGVFPECGTDVKQP